MLLFRKGGGLKFIHIQVAPYLPLYFVKMPLFEMWQLCYHDHHHQDNHHPDLCTLGDLHQVHSGHRQGDNDLRRGQLLHGLRRPVAAVLFLLFWVEIYV